MGVMKQLFIDEIESRDADVCVTKSVYTVKDEANRYVDCFLNPEEALRFIDKENTPYYDSFGDLIQNFYYIEEKEFPR